ncbi:hypothetical protein RLIN73S_07433 [Rhodanobacter lindaniclasticus]
MTGMRTAAFTAAMVAYSASPSYLSARVRPCTASAAMPLSSAMRAMVRALRLSRFQPVRIFKVTGTATASTTALTMRATSGSSCSSAEPAHTLHTFLAGQPMLMSMICAPLATLKRAASASIAGSWPAICTLTGSGSPAWSIRLSDLRVCHRLGSALVISEAAKPAPSRLHSRRNGLSVTPAIGASTTGGSMR